MLELTALFGLDVAASVRRGGSLRERWGGFGHCGRWSGRCHASGCGAALRNRSPRRSGANTAGHGRQSLGSCCAYSDRPPKRSLEVHPAAAPRATWRRESAPRHRASLCIATFQGRRGCRMPGAPAVCTTAPSGSGQTRPGIVRLPGTRSWCHFGAVMVPPQRHRSELGLQTSPTCR